MGDRTGKQCRERYMNHLQGGIKKGEWTEEEDRIIVEQQKLLGNQWALITKMLPGRSDNAVKNRWHAAQRHLNCAKSSDSKKRKERKPRAHPLVPTLEIEPVNILGNPESLYDEGSLYSAMRDMDINSHSHAGHGGHINATGSTGRSDYVEDIQEISMLSPLVIDGNETFSPRLAGESTEDFHDKRNLRAFAAELSPRPELGLSRSPRVPGEPSSEGFSPYVKQLGKLRSSTEGQDNITLSLMSLDSIFGDKEQDDTPDEELLNQTDSGSSTDNEPVSPSVHSSSSSSGSTKQGSIEVPHLELDTDSIASVGIAALGSLKSKISESYFLSDIEDDDEEIGGFEDSTTTDEEEPNRRSIRNRGTKKGRAPDFSYELSDSDVGDHDDVMEEWTNRSMARKMERLTPRSPRGDRMKRACRRLSPRAFPVD